MSKPLPALPKHPMSTTAAPPPLRLTNRIAIITGSSGRLGRAISTLFASQGATLFLADKYSAPRNPINAHTGRADDWENRYDSSTRQHRALPEPEADQWLPTREFIKKRYPAVKVMFCETDLADESQVQYMVEVCVEAYGRVDVLVNAHGVSVESTHPRPLPIHETSLDDFEKTLSINTTSLFLTMKYFLEQVMGQTQVHDGARAWIVNVASVQAMTPYYGTSSYCASKGAALMLTKQVALDYAPVGVRCNAVCPGFLDSDMTRNLQADTRVLEKVAGRHPLRPSAGQWRGEEVWPAMGPGQGGLGSVDDVAKVVLTLASDDAAWMTGQGIVVDGGYSIS